MYRSYFVNEYVKYLIKNKNEFIYLYVRSELKRLRIERKRKRTNGAGLKTFGFVFADR